MPQRLGPRHPPTEAIDKTELRAIQEHRQPGFTHGDEHDALIGGGLAIGWLMAYLNRSLLSADSVFKIEDLQDYGDLFEFFAELLRCELCFGHLYYNQVDPRTGERFRWADIVQIMYMNPASWHSDLPEPRIDERVDPLTVPVQRCEDVDALLAWRVARSIGQADKALNMDWMLGYQLLTYFNQDETRPESGPRSTCAPVTGRDSPDILIWLAACCLHCVRLGGVSSVTADLLLLVLCSRSLHSCNTAGSPRSKTAGGNSFSVTEPNSGPINGGHKVASPVSVELRNLHEDYDVTILMALRNPLLPRRVPDGGAILRGS
jgi:hypothetical protein